MERREVPMASRRTSFWENSRVNNVRQSRFLLRRGNRTQQSLPHGIHSLDPPIDVSHGCLLLPVFLVAWWYYTKQCIRKVTGFLRNSSEPPEVSEKFHDKFFRFDDSYIRWYGAF